jgi:proteasome accessory factor B
MPKTFGRYSPSRRFEEVRALLNSSGGVTVYEIAERLHISVRTAIRYLRALEDSGERIYDEKEGHRKVWRLMPSAREGVLSLTTSQMVSLFLSRRVFDFLEGTGFKEDLDEIFHQLEAHLKRKDFVATKNLERKLFDVNEAPFVFEGRIEDVNDIITALIREERLSAVHVSVGRGKKDFLIDPYTLLVYKKGLYLAGFSHSHQSVRTFGFDGFRRIDWLKGQGFEYPADFSPAQLVEGAFGLFIGPKTRVRILFDEKVARYVRRRQWHPSQVIEKAANGVVLTLEVRGTVELLSWVLGFGDKAEILEPESLRAEAMRVLTAANHRYL